jgi:hypothetical protein
MAVEMDKLISLVWMGGLVALVLVIVISRRARRHGGAFRAGVIGAMYEWQSKDKQNALDIIVEGRAAEWRPEYPEGDLPQLQKPDKRRPPE